MSKFPRQCKKNACILLWFILLSQGFANAEVPWDKIREQGKTVLSERLVLKVGPKGVTNRDLDTLSRAYRAFECHLPKSFIHRLLSVFIQRKSRVKQSLKSPSPEKKDKLFKSILILQLSHAFFKRNEQVPSAKIPEKTKNRCKASIEETLYLDQLFALESVLKKQFFNGQTISSVQFDASIKLLESIQSQIPYEQY
jgi:hypothetical protein